MKRFKKLLLIVGIVLLSVVLVSFALSRIPGTPTSKQGRLPDSTKTGELLVEIPQSEVLVLKNGFVDYVDILDRRFAQGVTKDNNATVVIEKMFGPSMFESLGADHFYSSIGLETPLSPGEYALLPRDWVFSRDEQDETTFVARMKRFRSNLSDAALSPWSETDFPEIHEYLSNNQKIIELLPELLKRERLYFPLTVDGSETRLHDDMPCLTMLDHIRDISRIVSAQAFFEIEQGDYSRTGNFAKVQFHLTHLCRQLPFDVSLLISIAVDSIGFELERQLIMSNVLDAEQSRQRINMLGKCYPKQLFNQMVDSHARFELLETIQLLADNNELDRLLGNSISRTVEQLTNSSVPVDWSRLHDICQGRVDQLMRLLLKADSFSARVKAMESVLAEIEADYPYPSLERYWVCRTNTPSQSMRRDEILGALLAAYFWPPFQTVLEMDTKVFARHELLMTAWAVNVFRLENNRMPNSLEELVKDILETLPIDPFSSGPLIYEAVGERYRLYSVGPHGLQQTLDDAANWNSEPDLIIDFPSQRVSKPGQTQAGQKFRIDRHFLKAVFLPTSFDNIPIGMTDGSRGSLRSRAPPEKKTRTPTLKGSQNLRPFQGRRLSGWFPVVFASLKPPATNCNSFGMKLAQSNFIATPDFDSPG